MKKYLFITLAFSTAVLVSCQKSAMNPSNEENRESEATVINAIVEDELITRSDYDINESTATFEWTSDDEFYLLVRQFSTNENVKTYSNFNHYTYRYQSGTGSSASFSGGPVGATYEEIGYALYPTFKYRSSNGAALTYSGVNDFYLNLETTLRYNVDNPLKNIVPMLGTKDGNTYSFKPLTGVLAIHLTNIPITATGVTLKTTATASQGGLSGKSVRFVNTTSQSGAYYIESNLGKSTLGLRRKWLDGNTKQYTFEANSLSSKGNEATFYFPIATSYDGSGNESAYNDITIIVENGESELTISKTGINLTIDRGEIVLLPTINCNYVGTGISATVSGTSNAIKAHYTVSKGTVTSVRAAAIPSKTMAALNAAIGSSADGSDITSATDAADPVTVSSGFSTSGKYYIGIKAFNGTTEVGSYIVSTPVYYYSSNDKLSLGVYKIKNSDSYKITISTSDDITRGNVMMSYYDSSAYPVNLKQYGVYSESEGTVVFESVESVSTDLATYAWGLLNKTGEPTTMTIDIADSKKLSVSGSTAQRSFDLFRWEGGSWQNLDHYFTSAYLYLN